MIILNVQINTKLESIFNRVTKKMKSLVLIVDDIKTNIEFIADIISSIDNIEFLGANSGEETLSIAADRNPDLILLDISMPKMDGYEVCRRLKENPLTADIPVIFLTARVLKEDIVKGFEAGAVDYISKPFNMNELLSRIKTHLELRHKKSELKEMNQKLEQKVEERTKQLSELNKNLIETNTKLQQANKELSTLERAKNDFIAHINHELRTPLNGIVGYASLLEESVMDDESKNYLNSINVLVSRLIKLSEISLLFTELQTVDHKLNLSEVYLPEIINKAINCREITDKNLQVDLENINESYSIFGEPRLITACITIIIDNAIKYSKKNDRIIITALADINNVILKIKDEGPGFSSNAQSKLFELFTADNLDYRTHGFGIGLATAKHIVELMGGNISIKNNEIKGASVSMLFRKFRS
jgi:two-component system sensor histidine kinase/response regulator